VLISKDSERTFATFLGASIELSAEDLREDYFKKNNLLYLEGYLLLNRPLINKAVELAKKQGMKIAIDLSSFNVVEQNLDFIKTLAKKHIDIIFANEEEAKAFCGYFAPKKNLEALAEYCEIVIVKIGKEGAMIMQQGNFYKIAPTMSTPIDTTGAGDLFAAGFLHGWARDMSIQDCGHIGSILAGKVIEVIGAKMPTEIWTDLRGQVCI
jgi:sugar/nucleoside kinase (ribokinase family)